MKIRSIRPGLALVVATGLLAACNKAPDTSTVTQTLPLPPETATAPVADAAASASGVAAPATASTPIPVATDDIWKALDKQGADLEQAVDGGAWKDVPARADAIRDLTAALPGHASKLPAEAQQALQQQVALVATYAAKLDQAAGAGDAGAAKDAYKKLNATLGGITRFP